MREAPAYVKSFTEDWLAYNPIPPLIYGNVQFANGANIIMEYTDCQPGVLKTQRPLKMVFRIKDVDKARSFKRYCWEATLTHGDL